MLNGVAQNAASAAKVRSGIALQAAFEETTLLILQCGNTSTEIPDCILHLEDFVTFMKYSCCCSIYSIVLLLGKQEQCYHLFAGNVGVSGHGRGGSEQGEVTSFVLSVGRYEK